MRVRGAGTGKARRRKVSEKEMDIKLFGDKFVCVFCNERKRAEDKYITADGIGICRGCYNTLSKTSLSLPYQGTRSIAYIMAPYEYTGALRQVILDFKFKNCHAYASLFAEMMREYVASYGIWEDFDYVIPVPLHESRLRERGYNQSELLAAYIAEQTGVPMRTDLLRRNRATKRQSSLKRYDRVLNVRGAFECETDITGRNIILFDDICTTGNTLQACAEALKSAGAENICALTLAIHMADKSPVIMY